MRKGSTVYIENSEFVVYEVLSVLNDSGGSTLIVKPLLANNNSDESYSFDSTSAKEIDDKLIDKKIIENTIRIRKLSNEIEVLSRFRSGGETIE